MNEKDYVVKDAPLECDKGDSQAKFNPIYGIGTDVGGSMQGVSRDGTADNIDGDFGTCSGNNNLPCEKAVVNPWRETSTTMFYNRGRVFDQQYVEVRKSYESLKPPVFGSQAKESSVYNHGYLRRILKDINAMESALQKLAPTDQADINLKEQLLEQIRELKEEQNTLWQNETLTVNYPFMLKTSKLSCPKYGGTIKIVEDGQNLSEPIIEDIGIEGLQERVRQVIRQHYDVGPTSAQRDAYAKGQATPGAVDTESEGYRRAYSSYPEDNILKERLAAAGASEEDVDRLLAAMYIEKYKIQITELQGQIAASTNNLEKNALSEQMKSVSDKLLEYGNTAEARDAIVQASQEYLEELEDSEPSSWQIRGIMQRKEYAEYAIEHLGINEEEDPLILIAWLALLNEKEIGTVIYYDPNAAGSARNGMKRFDLVQAYERIEEAVEDGKYEKYGIEAARATEFTEENMGTQITEIKARADTLERVLPLPKGVRYPHSSYYISYGYHSSSYGYNAIHKGVDIMTGRKEGIDVVAVRSGEISAIRVELTNSYGICPYIKNIDGSYYLYGHHKEVYNDNGIGVGFYVLASKPLGECGQTGRGGADAGIHVHFEVWTSASTDIEFNENDVITWGGTEVRTNPVPDYLPDITQDDVQYP